MLQQRPNTFAQTILSLSFFACDEAADHKFRFARHTGTIAHVMACPRPLTSVPHLAMLAMSVRTLRSADEATAENSDWA
jgi:hypothetical protein